jgi:hypothetical protein
MPTIESPSTSRCESDRDPLPQLSPNSERPQKDHPTLIGDDPTLHERAGHFLKGLADLFALLVAKLHEYGDALIAFAKRDAAPAGRWQVRSLLQLGL